MCDPQFVQQSFDPIQARLLKGLFGRWVKFKNQVNQVFKTLVFGKTYRGHNLPTSFPLAWLKWDSAKVSCLLFYRLVFKSTVRVWIYLPGLLRLHSRVCVSNVSLCRRIFSCMWKWWSDLSKWMLCQTKSMHGKETHLRCQEGSLW